MIVNTRNPRIGHLQRQMQREQSIAVVNRHRHAYAVTKNAGAVVAGDDATNRATRGQRVRVSLAHLDRA